MKKELYGYIVLSALCSILCGCATMFAPGADEVTIKSEPQGAEVYDGAHLLGRTPLTYSFVRNTFENKELTVRMEGRKSEHLYLGKTLEQTALYNFGFFLTTSGATSWGIDALTGHMIKYSPDSYLIILEKEKGPRGEAEQTDRKRLRFVMVNHECLKMDIVKGRGECLTAYYEIGPSGRVLDDYQSFLSRVSGQARSLLAVDDPLQFHRELEEKLHAVTVSQNGKRQDRP